MSDICKVRTTASIASLDVLDTMIALREQREPFAVAAVIETQGSIGFEVIVGDLMADRAHYPQATALFVEDLDYRRLDPHANDCVVVATQHKGDHESMARCPRSPIPYIALIASRKRSKLVIDYLREQGFDDTQLARVYAPAGLDLGARTPEEIALSILREIVMLSHKASGAPRRQEIAR